MFSDFSFSSEARAVLIFTILNWLSWMETGSVKVLKVASHSKQVVSMFVGAFFIPNLISVWVQTCLSPFPGNKSVLLELRIRK